MPGLSTQVTQCADDANRCCSVPMGGMFTAEQGTDARQAPEERVLHPLSHLAFNKGKTMMLL